MAAGGSGASCCLTRALVRPRGGLLQKPCLRASEGRRGSHLEQLRRIEISIIEKARRARDLFSASSSSSARWLEDLVEALHPLAENSVAALQLNKPSACTARLRVCLRNSFLRSSIQRRFLLSCSRSSRRRVSSRSSSSSCAMRCRWCERSASSSASSRGRS